MKAPTLALSIGFLVNQWACSDGFISSSVPSMADRRSQLGAATSLPLGDASLQPVVETTKEEEPNVGVLLLNLGGPEKTDDVEGTGMNNDIANT